MDSRSDNADLASLFLGDIVFSPDFASDTLAYTASVSNATTSLTVTPTKAEANATIEVRINGGDYSAVSSGSPSGALALNAGPNTVEIRVTAQDGRTQKTYTITVTRDKAAQTIAFTHPGNQLATATVVLTSLGGGSGNPVVFTASGPTSLDGNVLTFTGPGSVTVRANQEGNDEYHAAPEVSHSFIVTASPATITLGNLVRTYDGLPKTVSATTAPAGLPVTISYGGPAPVHAGEHPVTATITDPRYAGTASGTLVIEKAAQTIAFANPGNQTATATVVLSATGGGSGHPVTFAVTDGSGTISGGNVLGFHGSGPVTVTASQAGDDNHHAAADVVRTLSVAKASASVALADLNQTYDGTPRAVTASTSPPGLPVSVTYDGDPSAPVDAGSYAVVATIDDPVYQGSAARALVVAKAPQDLAFANPGDQLATATVNLSATGGGSGNAVIFTATGPATLSDGNVLTFTGPGEVTVTASQAGNGNYLAASVSHRFNVTAATATVTLGNLVQTYDGTPKTINATTVPAGLAVQIDYGGPAPVRAGEHPVSATITDPLYAGTASGTLVIGKAAQSIGFANPGNQTATATVNLSATGGGSGNAVTFSATGPATITGGNVLGFTGPGEVTVRANQAGNDNYEAAPEVSHTFTVTAESATIILGNLVQTYDGTPKTLSATTVPAGLSVEIDYGGPAPVNAGSHAVTVTITDPLYAGTASGTLVIEKAAQSIGFANPGNQTATATLNLSATGGGSGNPVTFAVTSGPATITGGNILTFTGPGEVTVTANQAENDNYHAAPQVSHTFNVTAATATLTLSRLHQVADGTTREVLATTDPADLETEITYDGETEAPTDPGTYTVEAVVTDPRYEGSASGTLVVDDPARMEPVPGGTLPALSSFGELSVPTFRIGAYEVTGSQWATVVTWAEANGYEFDGAGAAASGDHPVTGVSWSDAAKWCNARTEWENALFGRSLAPAYRVGGAVFKLGTPSPSEVECDFGAGGHRLPTAAEWEFAARGGVGGAPSTYPGGNDPDELGWHVGNSDGGTQPAGGKTPNGLGLHDFSGNAAEWTWDAPSSDPGQRLLRGGSWQDGAAVGALSALSGADPSSRSVTVGFRLVQSVSLALAEALDHPGLSWETGGDGLWTAQTGTTHDGEDAAESGASAPGQSSWLETVVEGPGNLRFQWKANGTEDADVLSLSVDEAEALAQTGAFGWEEAFVEIGEGSHILRWTHTRGVAGSAGAKAWLDSVAYEPATGASVTTAPAADVANTTATLGGEVLDDGGREVTERGVVYGTASEPTLHSDTVLSADEGGIGPFTVDATGLSEGTTYHVRAYATNNLGTVYGEEIVFTTGATVTFTDGTATFGREILPGGRQRFGFTLAGPRLVSFATSGGAGLRAELLDAQGNVVAVFEEGEEIAFERLLLAGNYVLEISRPAGEGSAQGYTLLLDAGRVASVRPEVVVGTTPTRLTGKLATVVSKKARPVKAHARIANRGNLPDALAVRAGKGNAFFKVVWFAPGNATAALTAGRYRTATLGEGAGSSIQVSVKPNKKKLTKRKGGRQMIQKKTLNLPVSVWSSGDASLKDAATIRVRTK